MCTIYKRGNKYLLSFSMSFHYLFILERTNKISTVALMIMIGDALHNFVDGISIGAAFTENMYLGISVSLAIICEELPHELGALV